MPYFMVTRTAQVAHHETFVVEAKDEDHARQVVSLDVEKYRLIDAEHEDMISGWEVDGVSELSDEVGRDHALEVERPVMRGPVADYTFEECAKIVERLWLSYRTQYDSAHAFAEAVAHEMRLKKSSIRAGCDMIRWPEPEGCPGKSGT